MCLHLHRGAASFTNEWDLMFWPRVSHFLAKAPFFSGQGKGTMQDWVSVTSSSSIFFLCQDWNSANAFPQSCVCCGCQNHLHRWLSPFPAPVSRIHKAETQGYGPVVTQFYGCVNPNWPLHEQIFFRGRDFTWPPLPHSWSRAMNPFHKIYCNTCTEVGKKNVCKCRGDMTCHRDGKSYEGRLSRPRYSIHTCSGMELGCGRSVYQDGKAVKNVFVWANKIQDYRDICWTVWAQQMWALLQILLLRAAASCWKNRPHLNLWVKFFKLYPNPDHLSATCPKADKASKQSGTSGLLEEAELSSNASHTSFNLPVMTEHLLLKDVFSKQRLWKRGPSLNCTAARGYLCTLQVCGWDIFGEIWQEEQTWPCSTLSFDSFDVLGSVQVVSARLRFWSAHVILQSQQISSAASPTQARWRLPFKHQPTLWNAFITGSPVLQLFLFTSAWPPHFNNSFSIVSLLLRSAPSVEQERIARLHWNQILRFGSGKASKEVGVGRGLPGLWRALAHLKLWPQHWSKRWGCALILVFLSCGLHHLLGFC